MARIKQGILGAVSGKVGTVVGAECNGVSYIRHVGSRKNKNHTQKQIERQLKLTVAGQFMRTIKDLVSVSYRDFAVKMSAYNAAMRYLMKTALTGQYPVYGIDYSLVLVSRGDIPSLFAPVASSNVQETVGFTWNTASGAANMKPDDKAILVAYCEAQNVSVYTLEGPLRSAGAGTLTLPGFTGQEVHTWVAFISADGSNVSNSLYAGKVIIA